MGRVGVGQRVRGKWGVKDPQLSWAGLGWGLGMGVYRDCTPLLYALVSLPFFSHSPDLRTKSSNSLANERTNELDKHQKSKLNHFPLTTTSLKMGPCGCSSCGSSCECSSCGCKSCGVSFPPSYSVTVMWNLSLIEEIALRCDGLEMGMGEGRISQGRG